jgi:uncharacterized tellurite resistance protein B-like protein
MFKTKKISLNPYLSFAVSLLYMASADGVIENDEITFMSTVMHGNRSIINEADSYIREAIKRGVTFDMFLKESNTFLTEAQKECIIVNLIDMMLADGKSVSNEEKLLMHIIEKYGFDTTKYQIYKDLMIKKNDHSVFFHKI